jgi:hypothetical protein
MGLLIFIRVDYSGSCNLSSKRRFLPTPHHHKLLCADSIGVPEKILRRLPTSFDLYKEVGSIIQGMHAITVAIRTVDSASQNIESHPIINHIDTKLHDLISTPDLEGGIYRRRYILLSFHILVLIYTALLSVYEGPATKLLIYRFEKALVDNTPDFGSTTTNLFTLLLAGEDLTSDTFAAYMSELLDVAAIMDWSSWRDVSNALLNFFVHGPACHGQLQDLWKERMAAIL